MMEENVKPCVHFVGFRGDEYFRAQKVFGKPDFIHRGWDARAQREIHPTDKIVFANGDENQPLNRYNFDDSREF